MVDEEHDLALKEVPHGLAPLVLLRDRLPARQEAVGVRRGAVVRGVAREQVAQEGRVEVLGGERHGVDQVGTLLLKPGRDRRLRGHHGRRGGRRGRGRGRGHGGRRGGGRDHRRGG